MKRLAPAHHAKSATERGRSQLQDFLDSKALLKVIEWVLGGLLPHPQSDAKHGVGTV